MKLTDEQLLKCYDIVFSKTHSDGFKIAEIKDVLYDPEYSFLESPKENWKENLGEYLISQNYENNR